MGSFSNPTKPRRMPLTTFSKELGFPKELKTGFNPTERSKFEELVRLPSSQFWESFMVTVSLFKRATTSPGSAVVLVLAYCAK